MHRLSWLPVLLMLSAPALAATNLDDYAFQARLGGADQQLQRVELPLDVFLASTRADLSDVVVFNNQGKLLPRAVTKAPNKITERSLELPFHEFSQFQQQRSKTVTTREQNQQDGSLSELQTTETVAVQSERKVYLVELASAEDVPHFDRLNLQWSHQPANQLLDLKLGYGNELDSLRHHSSTKRLANRESGDSAWRNISGIPRKQKYLRLTPGNSITQFELQRVTGHYQETEPAPMLSHPLATKLIEVEGRKLYFFEYPYRVQAVSMRVIPGEPHSAISGTVYSSHGEYDKRQTTHTNFYQHNISDAEVKPSEAFQLRRKVLNNVWLSTGGELAAAPRVELVFPQFEVVFLGDDNGPYTLAWGNHESKAGANNLTALLEGNLAEAQLRGSMVSLGQIQQAGGESRLAPKPELPWQKWMLWALLIFAALIAARMTFKLYREMNPAQPSEPEA